MGWMGRSSRTLANREKAASHYYDHKFEHPPSISHIENTTSQSIRPSSITENQKDLPFIEPDFVSSCRDRGQLWVVVDDIVYDCTNFAAEHPGGADVLDSFCGSNCSWQFWRFHGKEEMQIWGVPLRVGITKGVKNRFKEPPRFVGLGSASDE